MKGEADAASWRPSWCSDWWSGWTGLGILLVAGESGTGKSSLLKAGLMPRLAAGALGPGSERWPRRVIRPTDSPLRELAMQLADVADAGPVSVYRSLSAAPGEAPMLIDLAVRTAAGYGVNHKSGALADTAAAAPPRLVLVVDQFEELFTAGVDTDVGRVEREAFVAALHAAATVPVGPLKLPPALVVAAVRADFLGRLIAYPPLKAELDAGPFTVGPMSEAELRLAITGPAAEAGLTVEPAAIEAVIAEMREGAWGDVLLQAWKQLRDWLGDDQLDRALYSQVVTDAQTWESNNQDSSYLYQPGRLATIDAATARWQDAPTRYPPLPATSQAFLDTAHHAARRTTRRRRAVIAGLVALTVIAIGAAGIAVDNAANASRQHAIALSRQFAAESLAIDSDDPLTARRLAVAAWHVFPTDQARLAMTALLIEQQQGGYMVGDSSNPDMTWAAFNPNSKLLAIAEADGYVRLWNLATGQAAGAPFPADIGKAGGVLGVTFSPDGKLLASVGADGYVRLWNPATGQAAGAPLPADTGPGGSVNAVAFSPDGKLLASVGADGYVRLWNPATRLAVRALLPAGPGSAVNGVAFSPDGKLLATADAAVKLWNPATRQAVGTLVQANTSSGVAVPRANTGLTPAVNWVVAFSPDSKLVATVGDGTVQTWQLSMLLILTQHSATMWGRQQRQIGRNTSRMNRNQASALTHHAGRVQLADGDGVHHVEPQASSTG
jgi:WD domain, G-beta repeat